MRSIFCDSPLIRDEKKTTSSNKCDQTRQPEAPEVSPQCFVERRTAKVELRRKCIEHVHIECVVVAKVVAKRSLADVLRLLQNKQ